MFLFEKVSHFSVRPHPAVLIVPFDTLPVKRCAIFRALQIARKSMIYKMPKRAFSAASLLFLASHSLRAQQFVSVLPSSAEARFAAVSVHISNLLPDAPVPSLTGSENLSDAFPTTSFRLKMAPKYAVTIEPEYQATGLNFRDKMIFSGAEIFTVRFPVSVIVAAGISHADNSDPMYGTNSEAFAKRVGAAGARNASQILFSDAIVAPLLHEDPRYYVLGPGHGFIKRVVYAGTRVLITRTDNGRNTINVASLAGYGGSAALTQLYYPSHHRDVDTMLNTFGTSLGGLAIQHELEEFIRFLIPHQPK